MSNPVRQQDLRNRAAHHKSWGGGLCPLRAEVLFQWPINFLEGAGSVSDPGLLHLVPTWLVRVSGITHLHPCLVVPPPLFPALGFVIRVVPDRHISDRHAQLDLPKPQGSIQMGSQGQDISQRKATARKRAFAARKQAKSAEANAKACRFLTEHLTTKATGAIVAGYMPIQTEIDPRPTLHALAQQGVRLCLPVIPGHACPLVFREWTPESAMIEGDFGALIPRGGEQLRPDIAIIPMVGFDSSGARLGYGGGFYDRTLEELSRTAPVLKIGFAFQGQLLDEVPTDQYDHKMDVIVTETGVNSFARELT